MEVQDEVMEVETEYATDDVVEGQQETIPFRLTGRTMLLMKSSAGVNPLNDLVKARGNLTSKRAKQRTDDDIWEIYRLDFELALYYDEELGPYIPGVNVEAAILDAAKIERKGTACKAGVSVVTDKMPLQYRGPRKIRELWEKKFADIRPTKLKASSSLMTCRPCFPTGWKIDGIVGYNPAIVDRANVERWIKQVGDIGLCDYRKRYGKSRVEIL